LIGETKIETQKNQLPVSDLIPNKKFLFFSHTSKEQAYNRGLLKAILEKKIQLIDYELFTNKEGRRVTGFGRFAGVVGSYNAFYALGKKNKSFDLKRVHTCFDRVEMEEQLKQVKLDSNFKLVLTGFGKVGYGAREILELLPIKEVSPEEFISESFDEAVFTHLDTEDYYQRESDGEFVVEEFYENPEGYISTLNKYVEHADMYMACHFWDNEAPKLLTHDDIKNCKNLKVIADISCDIADPIASTLRPSTIADPLYGYNRDAQSEGDWQEEGNLVVMAVDNLPCELPKEASEEFGKQLIGNIIPHLLNGDTEGRIYNASETTLNGKLNEPFSYLQEFLNKG
ncbi:MAG: alanine dehydrogenase, partial [Crocinitomicaceae bacterium]|nr:alanine dehydrogenase [Crocinitomicaceae bacterium]